MSIVDWVFVTGWLAFWLVIFVGFAIIIPRFPDAPDDRISAKRQPVKWFRWD